MINKFFQTIFTLAKVVLKSKYVLSMKVSVEQDLIVLANGPSLQQNIIENREIFEKTDLAVVNHFCQSEYFFQLKPGNYFMLDPAFFDQPFIETVEKTFQILTSGNVDWNITFYLPWSSRKSFFVQELYKQKNFNVQFTNYVPAKGGFRGIKYWLFNLNLAMPQCQNVVVYTLFLATRLGAKRIFLFGAENNWHANVKVNNDNFLVMTNLHLYEDKKERTELVLGNPSQPEKRTTMVGLLESSLKAFKGYQEISRYIRTRNIQIYNCSKNSMIDSFERLDDEAFRKKITS